MTVRTALRAALLAPALAFLAAPALSADSFTLDSRHTFPSFEINHLGFSTMRGIFTVTTGGLTYDPVTHEGTASATIQTKSIFTGDVERDGHLSGEKFFNSEKFPTMSFKSDKFQLADDKPVAVAGQLTMLGVTKPVTLQVKPTKCAERMDKAFVCGAVVTGDIHRSDWGLNAYVPFIGDDVHIQIEVEAMRK